MIVVDAGCLFEAVAGTPGAPTIRRRLAAAEAMGATLVTTDARLAAADGPRCEIDVVPASG